MNIKIFNTLIFIPLALLLQLQKSKSNLDMDLGEFWALVMDRGAWRATVHGVAESDTTERLN